MKDIGTTISISLVSTSLLFATATSALAESADTSTHRTMPAPRNALELTIGTGYTQGTGELGGGLPAVEDVAGPGSSLETSIGWRATPSLFVGGYANLSGFADTDDSDKGVASLSTGLKADWHFLPAAAWDPWVSVGTGVKILVIEDGDNDRALTGFEIAKVQVGADYRFGPRFALGPVIAASSTVFRHQYDDRISDDAMAIDDKEVNWTFSAGLLGRFDLGGTTR